LVIAKGETGIRGKNRRSQGYKKQPQQGSGPKKFQHEKYIKAAAPADEAALLCYCSSFVASDSRVYPVTPFVSRMTTFATR
jgi:hypothetical protein